MASDLMLVGYWRVAGQDGCPYRDPRELVDPGWDWKPEEKAELAAYLTGGLPLTQYLGHSRCRFDCGIPDHRMGNADLTDGTWVWPEGLVHYVREHALPLPEPFVAHMREHDFRVPEVFDAPEAGDYDDGFWIEWCAAHVRREIA
ncbi:MAG: hypothetical protein ACQGVC_13665 [Myxococcota bacterium]